MHDLAIPGGKLVDGTGAAQAAFPETVGRVTVLDTQPWPVTMQG